MNTRIRTLIIDDEELARERIRALLASEKSVEIAGEAADGKSAVALIEKEKPDLIFLDVQMPELDGFDVLRSLSGCRLPNVIFVTAHDRFAVKAFEVHAVDYLLKPFDRERFTMALNRALQKIRSEDKDGADLSGFLNEVKSTCRPLERLLVKTEGRVILVKTGDIDWVEAADNYIKLHLSSECHLMRETMNSIESKLPPDKFIRISRSVIVNLERIREMQPMFHGEYIVILKNGAKLTLSRNYRHNFHKLMGKA